MAITAKKLIAAFVIVLSAGIVTFGGFYVADAVQPQEKAGTQVERPSFTFDAAIAPDWFSGANYWPDANEYTGNQVTEADLPVVSMTVNLGTATKPGPCFITYSYKNGPIDVAAEIKNIEIFSVNKSEGLILSKLGEKSVTMKTSEGSKDYQINQYEFAGPGSSSMAKGAQFAYIPLKDGHVEIRGYCETAEQLADTMPALLAVGFKA